MCPGGGKETLGRERWLKKERSIGAGRMKGKLAVGRQGARGLWGGTVTSRDSVTREHTMGVRTAWALDRSGNHTIGTSEPSRCSHAGSNQVIFVFSFFLFFISKSDIFFCQLYK